MVRVFCDRCGWVITGMSAHERVSVTASGAGGGEIAKLDFCTYCADWAINTLMRRTMLGAGEKKGAKADKPAPIAPPKSEKDSLAWTVEQDKRPAAEAPPPEPLPTLSAIVMDGLMVDIHVWRVIERGLSDLGAMEKKA